MWHFPRTFFSLPRYQQCSRCPLNPSPFPFHVYARVTYMSLSLSCSIHLSAKILVDFSRGLHPLPFHFPRTCHPRFSNPLLKSFRRLKSHSCAHLSRGSSLPRLRCSRRLPSDPPFAPSCLARETFFVRGSFTWLNNDREKDRTFRLKEYRHAAIARLQRRHRGTYAFTLHPSFSISPASVYTLHHPLSLFPASLRPTTGF